MGKTTPYMQGAEYGLADGNSYDKKNRQAHLRESTLPITTADDSNDGDDAAYVGNTAIADAHFHYLPTRCYSQPPGSLHA